MHDTMLEQEPMVESIHEESEQKKFFVEPTPTPFVVLFLWSLLLSVLSVANYTISHYSIELPFRFLPFGFSPERVITIRVFLEACKPKPGETPHIHSFTPANSAYFRGF